MVTLAYDVNGRRLQRAGIGRVNESYLQSRDLAWPTSTRLLGNGHRKEAVRQQRALPRQTIGPRKSMREADCAATIPGLAEEVVVVHVDPTVARTAGRVDGDVIPLSAPRE